MAHKVGATEKALNRNLLMAKTLSYPNPRRDRVGGYTEGHARVDSPTVGSTKFENPTWVNPKPYFLHQHAEGLRATPLSRQRPRETVLAPVRSCQRRGGRRGLPAIPALRTTTRLRSI